MPDFTHTPYREDIQPVKPLEDIASQRIEEKSVVKSLFLDQARPVKSQSLPPLRGVPPFEPYQPLRYKTR
jgi:hypothetical protein